MTLRWVLRIAAVACFVFLFFPALRHGWTQVDTDFPNYYTAAKLARHGVPLHNYYDWTWFQRQINYAGWGAQLGAYIPHPPLAMLPIFPLADLPPMTAKRIWLALNIGFLAATIAMLAQLTRLPVSGLTLLALGGFGAMAGNFEYGQFYVFVLFLMTWSYWLLNRRREFSAGLVLGSIFLLKLYAGPFLIYFAWKRRWRALAGMLAAGLALGAVAIAIFGWKENLYFLTDILPRALAGEANDPFSPGFPTPFSFLRHAFLLDPDVNPHPIVNAPAVVFFFQPLVMLSVLVFCVIALRKDAEDERRDFAWFVIVLLLVASNRSFYVGVLLLLPVALLLEKAGTRQRIALIAAHLGFTVALPDAWEWLYPTLWLLIAVYIAVGIPYWRKLRPAYAALAAVAIVCLAGFSAHRRLDSFYREPHQQFQRVLVEKDAVYSSSPAVSSAGVVYESIAPLGPGRYVLNRWKNGKLEVLPFEGEAFHPTVTPAGGDIYFELVAGGHSQVMQFDPESKAVHQVVSQGFGPTKPSISPDGQRLAFLASDGRIAIYSHGAMGAIDTPTPVHDVAWFPDSTRLVYSANSQIFATSPTTQFTRDDGDHTEPAVSPDGTWLAYTVRRAGTEQVWLQNLATGAARQLTEGICNNYLPAWEPGSRALIFASDCQRGLGLPVLFRAIVDLANRPDSDTKRP